MEKFKHHVATYLWNRFFDLFAKQGMSEIGSHVDLNSILKWRIKTMQRILMFLAALCPLVGYASNYCDNDNCCDCAAIGVEYVFLKPSVYDPAFVIPPVPEEEDPNSASARGRLYKNLWPYHSGVRVKGAYNLPCAQADLYGEGLYLRDSETRKVTFTEPNLGLATKGTPDLVNNFDQDVDMATSQLRYRLWSAKGGIRYCFDTCCPLLASARVSVKYVHISMREKIEYQSIVDQEKAVVDYNTHSWGVGPEIGFDVGYQILSCLAIVTRGSYALLAGRLSADSSTSLILTDTSIVDDRYFAQDDKMSIVIPFCELKLGFNYTFATNCVCANLEVGYNFLHYDNVLARIRWLDDVADGLLMDQYSPFMAHGLYVSLNTGF